MISIRALFGGMLFLAASLSAGCSAEAEDGKKTAAVETVTAETGAAAHPATHGKFLHLSDIHFDPLFLRHTSSDEQVKAFAQKLETTDAAGWEALFKAQGSGKLSHRSRQDTNYLLLKSALSAANAAGSYDYILYSGDYLAHDFVTTAYTGQRIADASAFAAKTIEFVNLMIEQEIGNTPIVSALGNNDSGLGDYALQPRGNFLNDLSGKMPIVKDDPVAKKQFEEDGYYTIAHPTVANHDFIALGIYWTHSSYRNCGTRSAAADGDDQLTYLDTALAKSKAAGRNVTLLMHIPPGVDGYSGYAHRKYVLDPDNSPSTQDTPMWCTADKFEKRFKDAIAKYADIVSVGFAGHTHMDEFRVMAASGKPDLAVRMSPSVTTYNGNNPSFTVFDYDTATGAPTDYAVTVLTDPDVTPANAAWAQTYRFSAAYGVTGFTPANLSLIADNIRKDTGSARKMFTANYNAGRPLPSAVPDSWKYFACALNELDLTGYQTCVGDPTS